VAEPDLMRIFARVASGLLVKVTRPPAEKNARPLPGENRQCRAHESGWMPRSRGTKVVSVSAKNRAEVSIGQLRHYRSVASRSSFAALSSRSLAWLSKRVLTLSSDTAIAQRLARRAML